MDQTNQLRQLIRESIQDYIREVEQSAGIAAQEAKIRACEESIAIREKKVALEGIDETMHEMIDQSKINLIKKEIKDLQKYLAKATKTLEKMKDKAEGKTTKKDTEETTDEGIIDEVSIDDEAGPKLEELTPEESEELRKKAEAYDKEYNITNEMLLMQKRAGIISETEYRIKVEEAKKKMTAAQKEKKEDIVKGMKKSKSFGKSKEEKSKMYATATKLATKKTKSLKEEVQALFEDDTLNEELEIGLTDLGDDFTKAIQGIFGDNVKLQDVKVRYRPSTDTGKQPEFTFGATIPSVGDKDNYKGALIYTNFLSDGNGYVGYDNYSKDKETTAKEFNEKLIPVWKKASALVLGNILKNPEELNKATVGSGYKYEEKDLENLKKYVASIPNLAIKNR